MTKPVRRDVGSSSSIRVQRFYAIIGARIRHRREELGLTQQALAASVNAARTSITNLEKGRQFAPLHLLYAIADELDVELSDLVPKKSEVALVAASLDEHLWLEMGGAVRPVPPATHAVITRLQEAATGGSNGKD